ncbi:uncharacterized protein AB675_4538 [Cyphellophora attinorum]|uniref:Uncharacterized protein n=1 Tax=Cyphellophora attinorum TaxID=1664694 RepID=A0A0N0NLI7_9EURO|nr:uncharacterized protein AB675_4538 [Phialophora attinorum]KPI39079.1 hypothetical protein AB675_4538 [Phialophora attinorum]
MSAFNDGSEDVDQFLARIASLSKKSGAEDSEQTRRMEEQRLLARKEREARRAGKKYQVDYGRFFALTTTAERARSISPSKTGPAGHVPSSPSSTIRGIPIDPPITLQPTSRSQTPSMSRQTSPTRSESLRPVAALNLSQSRELPQPPQDLQRTPQSEPPGSAGLSRSGTLSWQQRPTSRGIGSGFGSVRSRPLSRDLDRPPSRDLQQPRPDSPKASVPEQVDDTPSRKDIAAALGSRDPTWFRQTQDRGVGSAAYRKSGQDENGVAMPPPQALRLPGMESGAGSRDPYRLPPDGAQKDAHESKRAPSASPTRHTAAAYTSNDATKETSNAPDASGQDERLGVHRSSRDYETDLGRTSSVLGGRPPSPTKGLGGFVQSAMMRRSDSVSKRWSVQQNSGLKRGDSIASNKPSFNPTATPISSLGHARTLSRDPRAVRDGTSSPSSGSRPSSSHGALDATLPTVDKTKSAPEGLPSSAESARQDDKAHPDMVSGGDDEPYLSRSPSKTMDPRRWSPTKASWLESALSKPDSPRFSPTKEEPPPWKLDMQRSKSNKDLAEAGKRTIPHEPVSTPSLLRSPPPAIKAKPLDLPNSHVADDATRSAKSIDSESIRTKAEEPAPPTSRASKQASPPTSPVRSEKEVPKPATGSLSSSKKVSIPDDIPSDVNPTVVGLPSNPRPSSDRKPPVAKPKPATPPKTDFRSSLKSRSTPTPKASEEPEFKAVFGKLKKAQTQNYVAPDELKDNITRGKAGLAVTGGPQPRKRVDEFKESILAKKEEMKSGASIAAHKKADSRDASPAKAEPEIPEALQRRNTLHKSKVSIDEKKTIAAAKDSPRSPPRMQPKPKSSWSSTNNATGLTEKAAKALQVTQWSAQDNKSELPTSTTNTSTVAQGNSMPQATGPREDTSKTISHAVAETNKKLEPIRSKDAPKPTLQSSAAFTSPLIKAKSVEKKAESAPTGIAARLNPALAGLIARGGSPKPAASESVSQTTTDSSKATDDPANLTHMTKGRAKGPKRKAPKAVASTTESSSTNVGPQTSRQTTKSTADVASQGVHDLHEKFNDHAQQATPKRGADVAPARFAVEAKPSFVSQSRTDITTSAANPAPKVQSLPTPIPSEALDSTPSEEPSKAKSPPVVATKSPELRRVSGQVQQPSEKTAAPATSKPSPKKPFSIASDDISQSITPSRTTASKPDATPNATGPMPLTPSRSIATGGKTAAPAGLGLHLTEHDRTVASQELTPPPEKSFGMPQSPKKAVSKTSGRSLSEAIAAHFPSTPKSTDKADFDTEAILSSKSTAVDPIKTTSKQVWEVSGDGKQTQLSEEQQHLLFEDTLYLVVHVFETIKTSKKSTECYLWTGDSVSSSAAEDAQLFCRKIARENSAKLEVLKQGKESANFFAALGGIVVTRRSKASALYMLCGRRHLGHIVFDEVDFSPASLCSGFPYLISAKYGKLYFWKGQGSCGDEIGAARLTGMDLGLTGEIEEVVEGKEPSAFWHSFPTSSKTKARFEPSDIWAMRSMDEKRGFPCRLYRLELERPKSSGGSFWGLRASSPTKESNKMTLTEIEPFVQADLDAGGGSSVHVLDAWASIYIIPGTSARATDFVTALHIAQEMAVLTPSMQDRALLPSCEVVLGGHPPREARAAFRKYGAVETHSEGKTWEVAEVLSALD